MVGQWYFSHVCFADTSALQRWPMVILIPSVPSLLLSLGRLLSTSNQELKMLAFERKDELGENATEDYGDNDLDDPNIILHRFRSQQLSKLDIAADLYANRTLQKIMRWIVEIASIHRQDFRVTYRGGLLPPNCFF
jgi:hypothetical protein